VTAQAPPRLDLLALADDELVLGWRDSEWTGIAPFLEEDVAFSSIAQTEIGHARALYDVVAAERGTTADEIAFDRPPEEYRCAPLVELNLVHDWARTIARRVLYEAADAIRIEALRSAPSPELAGLAEKIDGEEAYHHLHAEMWSARLQASEEGRRRFAAALDDIWPYALGLLEGGDREELCRRLGRESVEAIERGTHLGDWPALWGEMTMVRRSAPGSEW
jgi:ring-1,2-phenylacetyl-CoA epoxidase subunit PaaC